jgi:hypothetical protein
MTRHVFFSWQADTPNATGRSFLRTVLGDVCRQIAGDTTLDEAERELEVDSDTQGVAGQPPIAETILRKIDQAAVVVADMTFVGKRIDGRPTPNPNVLIEYGWALKSLGHNRVITVMNEAFGEPTADSLPFDLAHLRWPTRFNVYTDMPAAKKREEKLRFTRELTRAVRASLEQSRAPAAVATPPIVDVGCVSRLVTYVSASDEEEYEEQEDYLTFRNVGSELVRRVTVDPFTILGDEHVIPIVPTLAVGDPAVERRLRLRRLRDANIKLRAFHKMPVGVAITVHFYGALDAPAYSARHAIIYDRGTIRAEPFIGNVISEFIDASEPAPVRDDEGE